MTIEERDKYIRDTARRKRESGGANKAWTDEEKIIRHEAILYELGLGKSIAQMTHELIERWGVSDKTITNYIKECRQYLAEKGMENIEEYRSKMIEKLERLAADAQLAGDRKTMLAAYDQISKLSGAYTQKVEADVKQEIKFDFGE